MPATRAAPGPSAARNPADAAAARTGTADARIAARRSRRAGPAAGDVPSAAVARSERAMRNGTAAVDRGAATPGRSRGASATWTAAAAEALLAGGARTVAAATAVPAAGAAAASMMVANARRTSGRSGSAAAAAAVRGAAVVAQVMLGPAGTLRARMASKNTQLHPHRQHGSHRSSRQWRQGARRRRHLYQPLCRRSSPCRQGLVRSSLRTLRRCQLLPQSRSCRSS